MRSAPLRPGGTLSSLGVYAGHLQVPHDAFRAGLADLSIVTTLGPGGKERMRRMMAIVRAKRFPFRDLVTHSVKLDDIESAYDLFANQRDGVMKVAIRRDGSRRANDPPWRSRCMRLLPDAPLCAGESGSPLQRERDNRDVGVARRGCAIARAVGGCCPSRIRSDGVDGARRDAPSSADHQHDETENQQCAEDPERADLGGGARKRLKRLPDETCDVAQTLHGRRP